MVVVPLGGVGGCVCSLHWESVECLKYFIYLIYLMNQSSIS